MRSSTDHVNINDAVVSTKDNIGDGDVSSVGEAEMRSSTYSINDNNDVVTGFDASTFPGDNFYDIFNNEDEIITKDSIVWINTNKKIGKGGSLKLLTVT